MCYITKSCLTNSHKMLNFVNFENGGTNVQRDILYVHVLLNILSISLLSRVNDMLFQDAKTFS